MSLFSGCGGLDLGLTEAGVRVTHAFDSDPEAVKAYNSNLPTVASSLTIDQNFKVDSTPEIIIASPPCQGFSTAGGYKGQDKRNELYVLSCEIIARIQPKIVLIENVASITNIRNQSILQRSIDILKAKDYVVQTLIVNCIDAGIPQKRKRAFLIARSNSRDFNVDLGIPAQTPRTVREAITKISPEANSHKPKFLEHNSKHRAISNRVQQGQKLCNVRAGDASVPTWNVPEVFGEVSSREIAILEQMRLLRRQSRRRTFGDADPVDVSRILNGGLGVSRNELDALVRKKYLRWVEDCIDLTHTFNGKYRRLELEGTSPTVDTRFGDCRLFLHPTEHRGLTVREAARIQGFPDSFHLHAPDRAAYRLIGNAVPPPLGFAIGKLVMGLR